MPEVTRSDPFRRNLWNGFGFNMVHPEDTARTLSARYYKYGSEILVAQSRGKNPRRLTPRECARLMGFDHPNERPFKIVVADTPAYKQFGNAVVVPVVEAIARLMVPHIVEPVRSNVADTKRPGSSRSLFS